MSHRKGKEFSKVTKDLVYYKQRGLCAICNEELGNDVEYNHKIPIYIFRDYFPHFSNWFIKSMANCEAVHSKCHDEYHRMNDGDLVFYSALLREIAQNGATMVLL